MPRTVLRTSIFLLCTTLFSSANMLAGFDASPCADAPDSAIAEAAEAHLPWFDNLRNCTDVAKRGLCTVAASACPKSCATCGVAHQYHRTLQSKSNPLASSPPPSPHPPPSPPRYRRDRLRPRCHRRPLSRRSARPCRLKFRRCHLRTLRPFILQSSA
eukprot:6478053-Prymnesium_polylepis.1